MSLEEDMLMGDKIAMSDSLQKHEYDNGTYTFHFDGKNVIDTLNFLGQNISNDNRIKGFYEDDDFMQTVASHIPETNTREHFLKVWDRARRLSRIALMHTELSEAVEGIRKDSQDDKLPHRKMEEVELADALIRILDAAGAYGMDLGGAVVEKLAYNRTRPYKHGKQV